LEQLGGDVGGVGGIDEMSGFLNHNKDNEGQSISENSTTTYNGEGGGGVESLQ
jgi:hypothetical protein